MELLDFFIASAHAQDAAQPGGLMSFLPLIIIFVIFLRIWLVKIATSSKARLVKFICLVHLAQPVLFYPTDMAFLRRMLHPVFAPLLHDLFQNNRWR